MRAPLIKVGDTQAVCIPPSLLAALGLSGEVDLSLEDGRLTIRPVHSVRAGWAEAAQRLAAEQEDALLDPDLTGQSEFDRQEWNWEGLSEG